MTRVLIAGAGLAGLRVAETLRARGYAGRVIIVGDERTPPYERPALSKHVLAGARDGGELALRSADWLAGREIELRLGSAVERVGDRTAFVAGRELTWDHLVLATGARARRLPRLPFAHVLRTLDDARALRDRLAPGVRLAVIGAGLVGAEAASSALSLGCHVTVVDPAPAPMAQLLGQAPSALLADRWRRVGVDVRFGVTVSAATPNELLLSDGNRVALDVLLVAVGVDPASELVRGGSAIATDACGRTGLANVYACGDVARFGGRSGGHWTAAAGQAVAVASTILGEPTPYSDPAYFWSDQFGMRLQMVGEAANAAATELEGDEESFSARYRDAHGNTVGILLGNRPIEVAAARGELAAAA